MFLCFFNVFPNFSNFKSFLIFRQRNSQLRWKRHFEEIEPFDTHSTKNFPHLAILKKNSWFFFEKPYLFSQKNHISFVHFSSSCLSRKFTVKPSTKLKYHTFNKTQIQDYQGRAISMEFRQWQNDCSFLSEPCKRLWIGIGIQ